MSQTLGSPRHDALRKFLIRARKDAGLTQVELAERLDRNQTYINRIETGQRRVDVVELIDLAAALDFDPHDAIRIVLGARAR